MWHGDLILAVSVCKCQGTKYPNPEFDFENWPRVHNVLFWWFYVEKSAQNGPITCNFCQKVIFTSNWCQSLHICGILATKMVSVFGFELRKWPLLMTLGDKKMDFWSPNPKVKTTFCCQYSANMKTLTSVWSECHFGNVSRSLIFGSFWNDFSL